MALSDTNVKFSLDTNETAVVGKGTRSYPVSFSFQPTKLTDGTGADQAQKVATVDDSVTAAAADTHDLQAIVGPFGTVNFTAIKELWIYNKGNADLIVGNAAANPWLGPLGGTTPTITVPPGMCLPLLNHTAAGWAVSGSAKNLKIDAASGTQAYELYIVGEGS